MGGGRGVDRGYPNREHDALLLSGDLDQVATILHHGIPAALEILRYHMLISLSSVCYLCIYLFDVSSDTEGKALSMRNDPDITIAADRFIIQKFKIKECIVTTRRLGADPTVYVSSQPLIKDANVGSDACREERLFKKDKSVLKIDIYRSTGDISEIFVKTTENWRIVAEHWAGAVQEALPRVKITFVIEPSGSN